MPSRRRPAAPRPADHRRARGRPAPAVLLASRLFASGAHRQGPACPAVDGVLTRRSAPRRTRRRAVVDFEVVVQRICWRAARAACRPPGRRRVPDPGDRLPAARAPARPTAGVGPQEIVQNSRRCCNVRGQASQPLPPSISSRSVPHRCSCAGCTADFGTRSSPGAVALMEGGRSSSQLRA